MPLHSSQDDDVRKYVNTYRRSFEKNGKKHSKAPKIQRCVGMARTLEASMKVL